MINRLDLRRAADPGATGDLRSRLPRPKMAGELPTASVRALLDDVRERGDVAVRELTERFDGAHIDELRVPQLELDAALAAIPPLLREALEAARASILEFHRSQLHEDASHERNGVTVREMRRAVDRAGLYVPGGRARYPSTVLMTAIPARVAGVAELVLCVPPEADGRVADVTLAAAALAGVDEVYRIGGVQAIAAMAYGTETIRPVDVIVGPGSVYVSVAKRLVAQEGVVGVPSAFAGPSEVVVVADDAAPPEFAATDVLVQAEHGPDGMAWLVTWSDSAADRISAAIDRLVEASPRRKEIESTLESGGYVVIVDGPQQAMEVVNLIAPEHLELMTEDPESLLPLVRHAGAVFTGMYAPASVGDYLAGPSHVLPTYGSARFSSALGVADFQKLLHVVSLDAATLGKLSPHVAAIADAEGLFTHADSVRIRENVR